MEKYSLVVHPYTLIDEVNSMKQALKKQIGWYGSVNALAHFSICEFSADDAEIEKLLSIIKNIASGRSSAEVLLKGFACYDNGAFYIKPTLESKQYLKELFADMNRSLKKYINLKDLGADPHLTIGRRLSMEQLQVAKNFFTKDDFSFICNAVMLRRFNEVRKQYDLFQSFDF